MCLSWMEDNQEPLNSFTLVATLWDIPLHTQLKPTCLAFSLIELPAVPSVTLDDKVAMCVKGGPDFNTAKPKKSSQSSESCFIELEEGLTVDTSPTTQT
jgi:hypothetical protein